jgi:hypothetical protein
LGRDKMCAACCLRSCFGSLGFGGICVACVVCSCLLATRWRASLGLIPGHSRPPSRPCLFCAFLVCCSFLGPSTSESPRVQCKLPSYRQPAGDSSPWLLPSFAPIAPFLLPTFPIVCRLAYLSPVPRLVQLRSGILVVSSLHFYWLCWRYWRRRRPQWVDPWIRGSLR